MRVYSFIAVVVIIAQANLAFGFQPIVKQALPAKPSDSESASKDSDKSQKVKQDADQAGSGNTVKKDSAKATPLGGTSIFGDAPLPIGEGGILRLPKLTTPSTELREIGTGTQPKDNAGLAMFATMPLPEGADRSEPWNPSTYQWRASNTFSFPLYFEDAMLERHGHETLWPLTPLYSGARFFATLPALPYLMTVQHPCDCHYQLGYWRAGSRAPCLHQRPPWQRDAALVEAAAITGAILIIP